MQAVLKLKLIFLTFGIQHRKIGAENDKSGEIERFS
jgi:hypothetical protein